jgi:hypothetical protein
MRGVPVSPVTRFGRTGAHTAVHIPVGQWRSGLYFAQLKARDRAGFAPFVVRPATLGRSSVLVVLPTYTWQAYNHHDDDGDGRKDTWYAGNTETVRLNRPFLARGVPPHFRLYDLPFLNWLSRAGKRPDFFSDTDLDAALDAGSLADAYRLIVFPGHHEYVTEREYDLIERYRDLGGHLMFLSGNSFYWKVVRTGSTIRRTERWRNVGRPEAALVGVQYIRSDGGAQRGAWTVRNVTRYPWIFAGTGLGAGSSFGHGGIEIDHTAPSSPRNVTVLAEIPDLLGRGYTAQMTYYETPAGGSVFAAGAFTLGGARDAVACRLLENLWHGLAGGPEDIERVGAARHRASGCPVAS